MDKTPISFQTAVRKWTEERRRGLADPLPDPEDMVAYREGKLEPDATAALRERLALQPGAARELLDLASFDEMQPPSADYRLSDADVQDALVAMRARIRLEGESQDALQTEPAVAKPVGEEPQAEVIPFPAERVRRLQTVARAAAMAALLTLVVGASWIVKLYGRLEEATGPRYAQVIDVAPTRGARPYAVSPDAEHVLLVFDGAGLGTYRRGQLVFSTAAGEVLHQSDLTASEDSGSLLTLELLRDLLPEGTYRAEVFGIDSEGRHPLREYRFEIEASVSPR